MYGCPMLPLSFLAVNYPCTRSRALVMWVNGVTAGLDVQYEPTKNHFFNEPEGLR